MVLLCREYDNGVTFVSSGYHDIVLVQFGSDGVYQSGFGVCVRSGVRIILLQSVYAVCYYFPVGFSFTRG